MAEMAESCSAKPVKIGISNNYKQYCYSSIVLYKLAKLVSFMFLHQITSDKYETELAVAVVSLVVQSLAKVSNLAVATQSPSQNERECS